MDVLRRREVGAASPGKGSKERCVRCGWCHAMHAAPAANPLTLPPPCHLLAAIPSARAASVVCMVSLLVRLFLGRSVSVSWLVSQHAVCCLAEMQARIPTLAVHLLCSATLHMHAPLAQLASDLPLIWCHTAHSYAVQRQRIHVRGACLRGVSPLELPTQSSDVLKATKLLLAFRRPQNPFLLQPCLQLHTSSARGRLLARFMRCL